MSIREKLLSTVRQLTPSGGRTERVVKSAIWLLSQNAVGRILQLVTLIILARLIGPAEVGLMGIALLALAAVNKFTNIGLNAALIQQAEENVDEYLNTTWILEIGRGVLIAGVLVLAAPLIASVFNESRATDVIRVIALSPILLGLRNPGVVYFRKNLDFHKQFMYKIGTELIRAAVTIGYVLVSPTVWAYVVGFIAADLSQTLLSYVLHGYRPWPRFDTESAKELVDYGKWITGTSILHFLYSEGDDAVVGWLVSPAALAFYRYGYRFSNAPATELGQVVASVMFPAFSKIQDDSDTLRKTFLQSLQMTSFVSFPAAFGIAAVAPTFVRAFLGEDWTLMIIPMQILAFYGLLSAIGQTFGPLCKALGRPDYVTKLSALRVAILAVLVIPVTSEYGVVGTAALVTGVYLFVMMPLDLYIIATLLEMKVTTIASEFVYPLAASALMGAAVYQLQSMLAINPIVEFLLLIGAGVVVYALVTLFLDSLFDWGITYHLRRVVANVKS
jgi:PST family polysaccharide transporter/lipopolysaccharide exporter